MPCDTNVSSYCTLYDHVDVAWFRDSKLLESSDHVELSRVKNAHFLTLFDPRPQDSGVFSCAALGSDGEIWHDFSVLVSGERPEVHFLIDGRILISYAVAASENEEIPPSICFSPLSEVAEGVSAEFSLLVGGHPEPRVFFTKEGKRLTNNENISIGDIVKETTHTVRPLPK